MPNKILTHERISVKQKIFNDVCSTLKEVNGRFSCLLKPVFMTTMVGFLAEMGSSKHHLDIGRNGAGQPSVKQSLCETVLQIVLQRLYERGQSLQYCDEVREHFRKLPARYLQNVFHCFICMIHPEFHCH